MVAGETVRGHRRERPGPRWEAERRAKVATAQPHPYYYDQLREVQSQAHAYRQHRGKRPPDIAALYLSFLEDEGLLEDESAARQWADFYAHFDVEPNSPLILVRTEQDYPAAAQRLLAEWQCRRQPGT